MGRIADITPVTSAGVAGYLTKTAGGSQPHLDHFLNLNGGSFVHASRPFWRAGRDGPPIKGGLDEAVRIARSRPGPLARTGGQELTPRFRRVPRVTCPTRSFAS
jgi:hypothetical protein